MDTMKSEDKTESNWVYAGYGKKTGPKFKRYTGETFEYVKDYLNNLGVPFRVENNGNLIFIYKEPEPEGRFSPRYSYYPTTGRWGKDDRSKHYHSKGIEDFMTNYYETLEESEESIRKIKEKRRQDESFYVKVNGRKEQVFSYEVTALKLLRDNNYTLKRSELYIYYPSGRTFGPTIKSDRFDLFGLKEVKRNEASTVKEKTYFKQAPYQLTKAIFSSKRRVDSILRQVEKG